MIGHQDLFTGMGDEGPAGEIGGVLCPLRLHDEGVAENGVRLGVVDEDVGGAVVNLDAFPACGMEHLRSGVGGESAIAAAGMPIGIDHRTAEAVDTGRQ